MLLRSPDESGFLTPPPRLVDRVICTNREDEARKALDGQWGFCKALREESKGITYQGYRVGALGHSGSICEHGLVPCGCPVGGMCNAHDDGRAQEHPRAAQALSDYASQELSEEGAQTVECLE
jgi:hypothetical protein